MSEQEFINITLGSLGVRDLLALEGLDLLPEDVKVEPERINQTKQPSEAVSMGCATTESSTVATSSENVPSRNSRAGTSGGITWFEDMMQGSQLGHHSKTRKGLGTSADGTTTISWEISEYYGSEGEDAQPSSSSKRKADDIETDDTIMNG